MMQDHRWHFGTSKTWTRKFLVRLSLFESLYSPSSHIRSGILHLLYKIGRCCLFLLSHGEQGVQACIPLLNIRKGECHLCQTADDPGNDSAFPIVCTAHSLGPVHESCWFYKIRWHMQIMSVWAAFLMIPSVLWYRSLGTKRKHPCVTRECCLLV